MYMTYFMKLQVTFLRSRFNFVIISTRMIQKGMVLFQNKFSSRVYFYLSHKIFIVDLAEEFPGLTEEYSLRQLFEWYGHKTDDYIDVVNLVKTCLLTIIE